MKFTFVNEIRRDVGFNLLSLLIGSRWART